MEGVGPAASVVTWSWAILAAPVDSAESLLGRNTPGEVPKPLRVTVVGAVKPGGADLRAGRPVDDLSSGGLHLVVEVAEHDDATELAGRRDAM
jgi:hypothetical protein